jgi:transposase
MAIVKIAEINAAHDILIAHLKIGAHSGTSLPRGEIESSLTGVGNGGCEERDNLPVKTEEIYCSFCGARNLVQIQNGHGVINRAAPPDPPEVEVQGSKQKSIKKRAYLILLVVIVSMIWLWRASHHERGTSPAKTAGATTVIRRVPQPVNEANLANFVMDMVEQLDLPEMCPPSRPGLQEQSSACDPRVMTALLFYSYCAGVSSSRQIEKKTYEDPIFKIISRNTHPDHFSIIDFRNRQPALLSEVFVQMLQLCQKAGFSEVGGIAVETGLSQPRKEASPEMVKKSKDELEKQVQALLGKSDEVDREEDKKYGVQWRGWDLPEEARQGEPLTSQ